MSAHICIPIVRGRLGDDRNLLFRAYKHLETLRPLDNSPISVWFCGPGSNCGTILFFGSVNQDVDIINVAGTVNWSPSLWRIVTLVQGGKGPRPFGSHPMTISFLPDYYYFRIVTSAKGLSPRRQMKFVNLIGTPHAAANLQNVWKRDTSAFISAVGHFRQDDAAPTGMADNLVARSTPRA